MLISLDKANDKNLVGNKAYALYQISKHAPIPEGFVVTSDTTDWKEVEAYIKKHCKGLYAVRSSSSAEDSGDSAFAGLFETKLGVRPELLLEVIQEVAASKHNKRVRAFCKEKGIDYKTIEVAVLVQRMVDSDMSGICFTKNPVNNRREVVVEAIYGLGEYVVGGDVTPDRYTVKNGTIKKQLIAQHKHQN